jgi:hypothetical protein
LAPYQAKDIRSKEEIAHSWEQFAAIGRGS